MKTDDAAARLEALGNPTRLQVYRALVRAGGAGMSVGLVTQERQATTLICRANYDVMRGLVDFLVAECCADAACAPSQAKGKAA